MDKHTLEFQEFWNRRQKAFGNTRRSVLFKNLPENVNNALHRSHVQFIIDNLPEDSKSLLDVGCGYGRLTQEIHKIRENIKLNGIELCEGFAKKFNDDFGPCFHGSMLEYESTESFDAILFVTVLMYAERKEVGRVIQKFWEKLNPEGVLICIEPCLNFIIMFKRIIEGNQADVLYLNKDELFKLFQNQPRAKALSAIKSFGILPLINWPILHYGFVFKKEG